MNEEAVTAPVDTEPSAAPDAAAEVFGALARRYNVAPDAYGDMLEFLKLDETRLPGPLTALGLKPAAIRMLGLMRAESGARSRRENAVKLAGQWREEAEKAGADLRALTRDDRFRRLLKAGFSVSDACRMTSGTDAQTRSILDRITSRALRPSEQAARRGAGGAPPSAADSLTRTEREKIERRALRGEKMRI